MYMAHRNLYQKIQINVLNQRRKNQVYPLSVRTDGTTVSMRVASLPKTKRLLPDLRVFVRGLCEMWILYFADFYG